YCHTVTKPSPPGSGEPPELAKPNIKDRWWEHAAFKHDTHRQILCGECHAATKSTDTKDVLLPGIDTCLNCHQTKKRGMARADCVECHVYHDPKQQKAAREKGKQTIEWLRK